LLFIWGEPGQRFIEGQHVFFWRMGDRGDLFQTDMHSVAAVFGPLFTNRIIHQNPPHGLGGSREEMPPAIPVLRLVDIHQAKIGFVHQCRGL